MPPHEKQAESFESNSRSRDHEELRELLTAIEQRIVDLQREVRQALSSEPSRQHFLSPDAACKEVGVSRASFDRWLADPTSGLADVIDQPRGPRTKIIIPMDDFVAWLGRRRSSGIARARRRA